MHSKDSNQRDELKDGYIKTIATFCRDKETKIIRSVLENCTRTAEEQKNKFIKPYAIIEALLNDDNFKLDVDKTALIIEWFIKRNVDEVGIELKEFIKESLTLKVVSFKFLANILCKLSLQYFATSIPE